jgi:hypothetical protein
MRLEAVAAALAVHYAHSQQIKKFWGGLPPHLGLARKF